MYGTSYPLWPNPHQSDFCATSTKSSASENNKSSFTGTRSFTDSETGSCVCEGSSVDTAGLI
ncbi:hypothetical protein OL67_002289 [Phaeobacter piscinae]|nr:hypothetical protein OL67_002289 [Phaeobacter piscinae]